MRFLSDASEQGGELLLYSDEPMDWMAGDRDYFALWASLMVACVKNGVRIKIIHNVDRAGPEIIDAIQGWFPLYISGTIEPYVFTRPRNARFCHTVFLHRGRACIHAFSPTGAADRWYDYLTEKPKLDALEREYETMLSAASPFLKTYPAAMGGDFLRFRMDRKGDQTYLLSGPPVATMPEGLLERMLSRAEISPETRRDVLGIYRDIRKRFAARLEQSSVNMILCPASGRSRQVNFSLDLVDLSLDYTPEEYGEHLAAVAALVEGERNFHLTLLPEIHADYGTGTDVSVEGYDVAVKTGTGEQVKEDGSGYLADKFVSSMIGFANADDAEVLVYVGLNGTGYHGSAAGGTFSAIMSEALSDTGVSPVG